MAQTIKIKQSNSSVVPSTDLAHGELAYGHTNGDNGKLSIGRPGTSAGNEVNDVIGGKVYVDKLNLIGADDTSVVATSSNLGAIKLGFTDTGRNYAVELDADSEAFVNVPWVNDVSALTSNDVETAGALMDSEVTNLAQVKAFSSSDYATAAQGTLATNALPKGGGTLTGSLKLGDANSSFVPSLNFGAGEDLRIYHDGDDSYIEDRGEGELFIKSDGLGVKIQSTWSNTLHDVIDILAIGTQIKYLGNTVVSVGNNETTFTGKIKVDEIDEKTSNNGVVIEALKLGTATTKVNSILDEDNMSSNSATALATQQSIKKYVDDSVPTSVANATNASNAVVTEDTASNALHYIGFYDNYTGTNAFRADRQLAWNPGDEILNIGTGGTLLGGDIQLSGAIKGPGTLYIDPAPTDTSEPGGSTTDTGSVVILGDLRVTGETTTVNSTTVSVGDNEIVLNAEHTGTPTLDAGIRVERGSATDVFLNWNENNDEWVVNEGQSSSPYYYTILHSNNFATAYTGEINGGTF